MENERWNIRLERRISMKQMVTGNSSAEEEEYYLLPWKVINTKW